LNPEPLNLTKPIDFIIVVHIFTDQSI